MINILVIIFYSVCHSDTFYYYPQYLLNDGNVDDQSTATTITTTTTFSTQQQQVQFRKVKVVRRCISDGDCGIELDQPPSPSSSSIDSQQLWNYSTLFHAHRCCDGICHSNTNHCPGEIECKRDLDCHEKKPGSCCDWRDNLCKMTASCNEYIYHPPFFFKCLLFIFFYVSFQCLLGRW